MALNQANHDSHDAVRPSPWCKHTHSPCIAGESAMLTTSPLGNCWPLNSPFKGNLGASFMISMVRTPLLNRELRPGTGKGTDRRAGWVEGTQLSPLPAFHVSAFQMIFTQHPCMCSCTAEPEEIGTKARTSGQNGLGWGGGSGCVSTRIRLHRERKNKERLEE